MALHISGKLCVIGIVLAALITAFSVPAPEGIPLQVSPEVRLNDPPRTAATSAPPAAHGPEANPTYVVRATAYNSLPNQTDATPYVTSTGARTRFGIIAVSRDLLSNDIPYGSLVRIRDLGNYYNGRGEGNFQDMLDSQELFIVEDTMHIRKQQQVDLWFPEFREARSWGVRRVEVEVVRYGRTGPLLARGESEFLATPQILASR